MGRIIKTLFLTVSIFILNFHYSFAGSLVDEQKSIVVESKGANLHISYCLESTNYCEHIGKVEGYTKNELKTAIIALEAEAIEAKILATLGIIASAPAGVVLGELAAVDMVAGVIFFSLVGAIPITLINEEDDMAYQLGGSWYEGLKDKMVFKAREWFDPDFYHNRSETLELLLSAQNQDKNQFVHSNMDKMVQNLEWIFAQKEFFKIKIPLNAPEFDGFLEAIAMP